MEGMEKTIFWVFPHGPHVLHGESSFFMSFMPFMVKLFDNDLHILYNSWRGE